MTHSKVAKYILDRYHRLPHASPSFELFHSHAVLRRTRIVRVIVHNVLLTLPARALYCRYDLEFEAALMNPSNP